MYLSGRLTLLLCFLSSMIRSSPLIGLDIILDHELSKNTLYLMHQNNFSLHIGKNGSCFSDASSHRNSWRSMAVWRKIMCYESIRENLWRTRRGNVYKHKLESVLYETFGWVGNQHCNNVIANLHSILTGSKHLFVFHSCSHMNFANFYRLRTLFSYSLCSLWCTTLDVTILAHPWHCRYSSVSRSLRNEQNGATHLFTRL